MGLCVPACLLAEVIGDAHGDEVRGEAGALEAETALVLPVSADVEVALKLVIGAGACSDQVVGEGGDRHKIQRAVRAYVRLGEVVDAATPQDLGVGNESAVGAEVPSTNLI